MFAELKKIPVFLSRDLRMLSTYKLAFSMSFLNMIFTLFYFVFFGQMFGSGALPQLEMYGGDFVSYLIVGSMGWGFLWSIMGTTSSTLRNEMMMGTVESILLTKTKISTMMLAYALYGSFFGFISIAFLLVVGYAFFGLTVFASATLYTLLIFFLSATMMFGFGMIFGGLTIWLKNIGAVVGLLQSISMFFCGVYFPITVLPEVVQPVSRFIPFYYSIEGFRRSLFDDITFSELAPFIAVLLVFSVVFVTAGILLLHKGLMKAKKDGSLMFY